MTPLTESQFQKRIMEACQREEGCHAIRISRMWAVMGGVPDLYIKHPAYPAVWLELKVNHKKGQQLIVGLSPLQRHFIRRENEAGGNAGWAVLNQGREAWTLYAGRNPNVVTVATDKLRFTDGAVVTSPVFNIVKILEAVVNGQRSFRP